MHIKLSASGKNPTYRLVLSNAKKLSPDMNEKTSLKYYLELLTKVKRCRSTDYHKKIDNQITKTNELIEIFTTRIN